MACNAGTKCSRCGTKHNQTLQREGSKLATAKEHHKTRSKVQGTKAAEITKTSTKGSTYAALGRRRKHGTQGGLGRF